MPVWRPNPSDPPYQPQRARGTSQPQPVAAFTGTPLTGTAPLSVAFTDSSSGGPTSWAWTFGDGNTSTSQNPTNNYAAGTYSVTLVVTNGAGSSALTRTSYVTASPAAQPASVLGHL